MDITLTLTDTEASTLELALWNAQHHAITGAEAVLAIRTKIGKQVGDQVNKRLAATASK